MSSHRHAWLLVFACLSLVTLAGERPPPAEKCIQPCKKNPRYWAYREKPVLLLGGSKTDHIFLAEGLMPHLDEMAAIGANYVRNTMSQREGVDLKPHLRLPDGRFDLNKWNPVYWEKFDACLKACEARGIIMQIEVWDRFDFSQEHWAISPWNPKNNINYSAKESGLAHAYPAHPWQDRQPFFHTLRGMPRYKPILTIIRQHQERFVEKMLSYSLKHGNVLYCMNNETSTPPAWGLYWMAFIRKRAAAQARRVYVTDMFDDGWKPEQSAKLRQAFDQPALYDFIDISQINSRNFNQAHWDRFSWVTRQIRKTPRPLNNTKIYSDGETRWGSGTPRDGVERFWRNLLCGAASCRFHRPGAGIGLNDTAKACIQAARKAESLVPFWTISPRMALLKDRESDEAYLAAAPGRAYVLYFTQGGAVKLVLKGHEKPYQLRWINIATGQWGQTLRLKKQSEVALTAPSPSPWTAVLTAASQ